jgi:hypothetical protein
VKLAVGEEDEAPAGIKALAAARAAINGQVAISSSELIAALNGDEELPFGGWNHGNGITARDLARLLKRYQVKPRTVRLDVGTAKGYRRDQFDEVWDRYLPPSPREASQATQPSQPASHGDGDVTAVTDVTANPGDGGQSA